MSDKPKKLKQIKKVSKSEQKKLEKKRLKKYSEFMKDNHDWDYRYIIDLLRFKIKMTRKHILQHDIIEKESMALMVAQMTETETLLKRACSNEHLKNIENDFKEKYGGEIKSKMKINKKNGVKMEYDYSEIHEDMLEEAKLEAQTFYDKEEELKKADLKKAFDIMSENIWDWWD